jgi:hypothetical protein
VALTFEEIKERLKSLDELTLLELFDLTSEDLVEKFDDLIEEDIDFYETQVSEESDTSAQGTD